MRRRYKVVLEVMSNFEGVPEDGVEVRTIKGYLESFQGVGVIVVSSVELVGGPTTETQGPEASARKVPSRQRPSKRPKV